MSLDEIIYMAGGLVIIASLLLAVALQIMGFGFEVYKED